MARMYPRECPPDTKSGAERELFDVFRDKLGPDYIVIHSLPWLDDSWRYLREGECDYLLFHPELGLLALEAKSGEIRYDREQKIWYQDGRKPLKKDPYLQASTSCHVLNRLLGKRLPWWAGAKLPFGHGVIFPDADSLPGALPPHVNVDITLLRGDLPVLPALIEKMSGKYGPPGKRLTPEQVKAVVDVLLPEFKIVRSLSARLEDDAASLFRLTGNQFDFLEGLKNNPRMLVKGCAGSGKSILAMEKALQLANEGAEVLLLCFNRFLAANLRKQISARGGGVDVYSFHSFCRRMVLDAGHLYNVPQAAEAKGAFYTEACPALMLEALPDYKKRYDAIIVDEGQDFHDDWWIAIEELLRDPKAGIFYIFTDPYQSIYRKAPGFLFDKPEYFLPNNCRNTKAIAEWTHALMEIKVKIQDSTPQGDAPVFHRVENEQAERDEVRKTLHDLVNVKKLSTDRIIILDRHKIGGSSFAAERTLGNFRIVDLKEARSPSDIRYSTIQAFKGLEADCVLLTGVGTPSESIDQDHERILTYVGASRAKLLLHVFYRPGCFIESMPKPGES